MEKVAQTLTSTPTLTPNPNPNPAHKIDAEDFAFRSAMNTLALKSRTLYPTPNPTPNLNPPYTGY